MRPARYFSIIQLSNSRVLHSCMITSSNSIIVILIQAARRHFLVTCPAFREKTEIAKKYKVSYNPVFDSCWKEKSLYPLYLLGYSDFCRCFGL